MHLIFYKSNDSVLRRDSSTVFDPESWRLFTALKKRQGVIQRIAMSTKERPFTPRVTACSTEKPSTA